MHRKQPYPGERPGAPKPAKVGRVAPRAPPEGGMSSKSTLVWINDFRQSNPCAIRGARGARPTQWLAVFLEPHAVRGPTPYPRHPNFGLPGSFESPSSHCRPDRLN